MTQKELLYVEDAYNHEENMITIVEDIIKSLKAKELKTFLKKELKKHETMKTKLLNVLEDKCNE